MRSCLIKQEQGIYQISFLTRAIDDSKDTIVMTCETVNYHDLGSWVSNWLINEYLPVMVGRIN